MRGSIFSRSKGSWTIVLPYTDPVTGGKGQEWLTYHGKKSDAEAYMNEIINNMNAGTYVKTKHTVRTWLQYWLEEICEPTLAPATYKSYKETVDLHLMPEFGHLPLPALRAEHLRKYYNKKLKTLSSTSVLYHHRVLHKALEDARRERHIKFNPCDDLTPPQKAHFKAELPTAEQTGKVLQHINGTTLYMPVILALTTGMRRGEVCGLTWGNIDFARGIIHVDQQLKKDSDNNLGYDLPKRNRKRDIPITDLARAALLAQQNAQTEAKKFYGEAYQNNDLVCCWDDGREIDPDYVTKRWGKVRKKLKLNPKTRYHDLRHNFATVLLDLGKDPKVVSELLGHADIRTTYNFYIHPKMDTKKKAIEGLDDVLVSHEQTKPVEDNVVSFADIKARRKAR